MVYFVGAGSGAPDLITVRGQKLLKKADVVIYAGSLVNEQLLENCKDECEIYNSAYMNLSEVLSVMFDAHERGLTVVRLHTGDPSIYGAIREQMDALDDRKIPYEVCPGVSSFCAAAAALNAEYTLPGVSQSVIITRIAGKTPVKDEESLRSFAAHKASMVIFLSMGYIDKVVEELTVGGYDSNTPAAIVYKASWDDQKIIRCPLHSLAAKAGEAGITRTALIVVGGFLGDDYELSKLYDAEFTTMYRKGTGK